MEAREEGVVSEEDDGRIRCMFCSHLMEEHEPYAYKGDRELMFCNVKGCGCEVLEGEA